MGHRLHGGSETNLTESGLDQRRFPRIRSGNSFPVKRLDDETIGAFGKTRVIGIGGCMFVSEEEFGPGTLLGMAISVQGRAIQVVARVAYLRPQGSRFETGVEFLQADPWDRGLIEDLFRDSRA
jgi:hypothetical protein